MSGETSRTSRTETVEFSTLSAGATSGVVGGVAFGAMITAMMRPVIAGGIPALWGLSGLAAGWLVHLVNAAVFGVVFAWIVEGTSLREHAVEVRRGWALGAAWGVVLWAVGAALVMPLWLSAVGFPAAPAFPNFNPATLPGHVVYGVVLGFVYAVLRGR